MRVATRTTTFGTETADGFIPYARVRLRGIVIDAPVRVVRGVRGASSMGISRPTPERTNDGRLVYALPRGGWIAQ